MAEGHVFMIVGLPQPWPPRAKVELFTHSQGDALVKVSVDTHGRFGVEISSSNDTQSYLFQPIVAKGSGHVLIDIGWSQAGARLHLHGREVSLDEKQSNEAFVLETNVLPVSRSDLVPGMIDVGRAKSDAERLFLGTIVDIARMLHEGSWYSFIRAAGLLWQLLLDQHALVHAVNRTYKEKLEFETHDYTLRLPIPPDTEWIDLDPSSFPGAQVITSNLDGFLNAPCLMTGGVTATVQDLIGACANAKGGRHLGQTRGPRKAERQSVIDWDRAVRLLGKEPSELAVAGVCRISLKGLRPLVDAIMR